MIWCNYKIYYFLKTQKSKAINNENYCEIQAQITRILIAQSIVPIFVVILPLSLLLLSMYGPVNINPRISAIPALAYGYLPMMNAASILAFVKAYRNQTITMLKNAFLKVQSNGITRAHTISHIGSRGM